MTVARSARLRPGTRNKPLLLSQRCSLRYTRAASQRLGPPVRFRAHQDTGTEFKEPTGKSAIWEIWQFSKGALVRLCSRLIAVVVLLAAACLIPFRASAHSPSSGTSMHQAAHVAVATDALSQNAPHNTIVPTSEPMVDMNAQLRGSVATAGSDEPSSQENSNNTESSGKGNGWNIFGEPNEITKLTRFDEATYYFHKALTSGTLRKSFALLVMCIPVVVVLGPLYGRASDRSWARGMYLTFCTLLRVPSPVYKEKKIWAAIVLNTVFMCGLFVFAVFLGLITEDVKQRVALIKEGITPVACKHHTVICYWNESTPALLRQISKARKGRDAFQGTVVVVADRDKFEMDQEVEQEVFLKTNERFDVETRRGSPMDVSDLQRAGVGWASTVFVMLPGQDTTVSPRGRVVPEVATLTQRNALKVSTALRVSSLRGPASEANGGQGTQEQRLVLQDCSGGVTEIGYANKFLSGYSAAEKVTNEKLGPACQPLGEHVMTSLAAQCACRPGLARVVDYLFTHDPQREQLRYMDITVEDHVATYGELRRRLSGAAALGYWSASENKTFLNPKDSSAVVPGDQMLVLSKEQPKFTPESVVTDDVVEHAQQWMSGAHRVNPKDKPKRVIVLNWMQDLDTLLQHFSEFSPAGSEIVFVHREKKFIPARIGSVRFRQVVSQRDLHKEALMKAGFQDCDAIVYGPNLSVSNYVYDSQLISDIMVLQSWYNKAQSSARLHILAPARDPFTASVVHHVLKDFGDAQVRLQKVDPETRVSEICSLQKRSIGDSTAQPDGRAQAESAPVKTSSEQQVNSDSDHQKVGGHKKQELPLQHVISAELYMPREFATAMMVHVSMQPKLMNILQELFDSQSGHSIWLRPAQYLHINSANDPDPVSFAWLAEAARARGETALGIITREGEVQLAPPVQQMFKFRPGDRIVVIQHQPPKKNNEIQGGLFKRRFRHKPVQ